MARRIVIAALVLHLCSLFLPYQTEGRGGRIVDGRFEYAVTSGYEGPMQTGLELKPYAPYVLVGLLLLFLGSYSHPLWDRWGYVVTVVLVVIFAMGGTPLRASGGKLSMVSLGLLCLAAVIHWRQTRAT